MIKINPRKKYVISKGIQTAIAITAVILILIALFFIFLARVLSKWVDPQFLIILVPPVLIVVAGLITVILLTILATHRVIGPFDRLKKEMDLIKSREHHRRLHVRDKDDQHVKSFISKINMILEEFEQLHSSEINLLTELDNELSEITVLDTDTEGLKEKDNGAVLALHEKIKSKLNNARIKAEENISKGAGLERGYNNL